VGCEQDESVKAPMTRAIYAIDIRMTSPLRDYSITLSPRSQSVNVQSGHAFDGDPHRG
jgi:hypothetical protein